MPNCCSLCNLVSKLTRLMSTCQNICVNFTLSRTDIFSDARNMDEFDGERTHLFHQVNGYMIDNSFVCLNSDNFVSHPY